MTCHPIEGIKKEPKTKNPAVLRMLVMLGFVFFAAIAVVSPASAEDINWSNISAMANGIAGVMPAIGNIIQSIISPILMLVFVGFFVGLFDSLLGGIESAFRFGRR